VHAAGACLGPGALRPEGGRRRHTTVAGLLPALDLVHGLAARGVPLRDGDGWARVKIMQAAPSHGAPDASGAFAAAGLVPEAGLPRTLRWELSPAHWPDG
jgi:hypothetical protein